MGAHGGCRKRRERRVGAAAPGARVSCSRAAWGPASGWVLAMGCQGAPLAFAATQGVKPSLTQRQRGCPRQLLQARAKSIGCEQICGGRRGSQRACGGGETSREWLGVANTPTSTCKVENKQDHDVGRAEDHRSRSLTLMKKETSRAWGARLERKLWPQASTINTRRQRSVISDTECRP